MSINTCEQSQLTNFCCVSIERDAHTTFIRIEGELDLSCEDGFRAEIAHITAWQPGTVVVALSALPVGPMTDRAVDLGATYVRKPDLRRVVNLVGSLAQDLRILLLLRAAFLSAFASRTRGATSRTALSFLVVAVFAAAFTAIAIRVFKRSALR